MVNTHVLSNGTDEVITKLADDISVTDTNGNALTDVTFAVDEGGEVKVSFKNVEGEVFKNIDIAIFKKTFVATEKQYQKAYQLWGEEKWDELFQYFKANNLNGGWPPFNGVKSIIKTERGNQLVGKVFDRFQKYEELSGSFASPVPQNSTYTIQSRALGVNYDEMEELGQSYFYIKFKIENASSDLTFEYGQAMPWFNELGGAQQIKSSQNLKDISVEILEKWRFNSGSWEKIK